MKKYILLLFCFSFPFFAYNQVYTGTKANQLISGSETIRMNPTFKIPTFISFRPANRFPFTDFIRNVRKLLKMTRMDDLKLIKSEDDDLGFTHYRYCQIYQGKEVEGTMIIAHVKEGKVVSFNGEFYPGLNIQNNELIEESKALTAAKSKLNANTYKWEIPMEEVWLKKISGNPEATYFPKGELVVCAKDGKAEPGNFRLAYRFNIYAQEPLMRKNIFVDATTGSVIFEQELIHEANAKGKAKTKYSDTQTITTDSFGSSSFRLREKGRGNGVETYNLATGTSYSLSLIHI